VGAAMLMTTVRAFLISSVGKYSDPAGLLNEINRWISRDCATSGNFTTMFFLELHPYSRQLRWVRAGHEPPLHYHRKSNEITKLEGEGIVLGIDESYEFANQLTDVEKGDVILVGTDGIFETRNSEQQLFGHERVNSLIAEHREAAAADIQQAIVSEVKRFRGDLSQEDDITMVVIKVG
ncbi:MAG: serine/threonine-protein phosphatase, partial [Desulfofustis sp.]|nr:serine/threonine-protein phosphatase [Desulfofustis sp.]